MILQSFYRPFEIRIMPVYDGLVATKGMTYENGKHKKRKKRNVHSGGRSRNQSGDEKAGGCTQARL